MRFDDRHHVSYRFRETLGDRRHRGVERAAGRYHDVVTEIGQPFGSLGLIDESHVGLRTLWMSFDLSLLHATVLFRCLCLASLVRGTPVPIRGVPGERR